MNTNSKPTKPFRGPLKFGILFAALFGLLISAKLLLVAPLPRQSIATPPVVQKSELPTGQTDTKQNQPDRQHQQQQQQPQQQPGQNGSAQQGEQPAGK